MNFIRKYPNLSKLFNKCELTYQNKIINLLSSQPSISDGIGHVYGFDLECDNNTKNNYHIKIGYTQNQSPHKRIQEWKGQHLFSYRTIYCKICEKIIFAFFGFLKYKRPSRFKPNSFEIEWFHFMNNYTLYQVKNIINDIVELVEDVFIELSNTQIKSETEISLLYTNIFNENLISNEKLISDKKSISDENLIFDKNTIDTKILDKPNIINEQLTLLNTKQRINLNNSFDILRLNDIMQKYYPSNTFHQSEKKYLFNALTFCYKNDKLGEIENIQTQQKLLDVMSKYDKSCYFHVDPRREIFASVKKYIC